MKVGVENYWRFNGMKTPSMKARPKLLASFEAGMNSPNLPWHVKAAGDKLLMNKFIRQKFGGGLMLKNVISYTFGSRFRLNLTESLINGGSATRLLLV